VKKVNSKTKIMYPYKDQGLPLCLSMCVESVERYANGLLPRLELHTE